MKIGGVLSGGVADDDAVIARSRGREVGVSRLGGLLEELMMELCLAFLSQDVCVGVKAVKVIGRERLDGSKLGVGWVMRGSWSWRSLAGWRPRVWSWRRRVRALKMRR